MNEFTRDTVPLCVKTKKEPTNINSLPDYVLINIFSRLEFHDICLYSRVCKRWRRVASDFTLKRTIIVNKPVHRLLDFMKNHFTDQLKDCRLMNPVPGYEELNKTCCLEMCKRCKNIKRLDLKHYLTAGVSLNDFPTSLTHLSLPSCMLESDVFFSKCDALSQLTCLVLSNCCNYLTQSDIVALSTLQGLRALYLDGCSGLGDDRIAPLQGILPRLEVLGVGNTSISNVGVHLILQNCGNMRELFLCNLGNISNEALRPDLRTGVASLSYLCVRNSRITLQQVHKFLNLCPERSLLKVDSGLICNRGRWCYEQFSKTEQNYYPRQKLNPCEHYLSHLCPHFKKN